MCGQTHISSITSAPHHTTPHHTKQPNKQPNNQKTEVTVAGGPRGPHTRVHPRVRFAPHRRQLINKNTAESFGSNAASRRPSSRWAGGRGVGILVWQRKGGAHLRSELRQEAAGETGGCWETTGGAATGSGGGRRRGVCSWTRWNMSSCCCVRSSRTRSASTRSTFAARAL